MSTDYKKALKKNRPAAKKGIKLEVKLLIGSLLLFPARALSVYTFLGPRSLT